jgi:hypothetical protein
VARRTASRIAAVTAWASFALAALATAIVLFAPSRDDRELGHGKAHDGPADHAR